MRHEHQPGPFSLSSNGQQITYKPDISVGGIYLEPHGNLDDSKFIEKMKAFKETYPKEIVVLISSAYELAKAPIGLFSQMLSTQELTQLKPLIKRLSGIHSSVRSLDARRFL